MKAVVLRGPMDLALETIAPPRSTDDFLVVDVKACGICGSDLRYYMGDNPWALQTCGKALPNPPNMVLGHEFSGVVSEVKNPLFRSLLGKRVAVLSFKSCGHCANCLSGLYHLCAQTRHIGHGAGWGKMDYYPGGMADKCAVWNENVIELPPEISFEEATLLDPLTVALHAIHMGSLSAGDDVLVLGAGPVGLCIAQAARALGAGHVLCTDVSAASLEIARRLGIERAVDVRTEDTARAVLETAGRPTVSLIFDTVGTPDSQRQALSLLRESGTLVNLVSKPWELAFSLMDVAAERRIISTANGRMEDYLLGIELLKRGKVDAGAMITHTIPIDDIQKGMDMMRNREKYGAMKIVVEMQGEV